MESTVEYRVTISKVETFRGTERKWVQLRERYKSEEETWLGSTDKAKQDLDPQFGYRDTPTTITKEVKLYEQTAVQLELSAVIKAVNNL